MFFLLPIGIMYGQDYPESKDSATVLAIDQLFKTEVIQNNSFPLRDVRDIDIDQNGFVWIASRIDGLARFDGNRIKKYDVNLIDGDQLRKSVRDVSMDKKRNVLWLTCTDRIVEYDLSKEIFQLSWMYEKYPELNGLKAHQIHRYKDQIWFTFNHNRLLILFDDDRSRLIQCNNEQSSREQSDDLLLDVAVIEDSQESHKQYIIGSRGIVHLNTRDWTYKNYPVWEMDGFTVPNMIFRDAILLKDGGLLIATWGHGICQFNTRTNTLMNFPLEGDFHPKGIQDITRISDSIIYLDTEKETFILKEIVSNDSSSLEQVDYRNGAMNLHFRLDKEIFLSGKDNVKLISLFSNQVIRHDLPDELGVPDMRHMTSSITNGNSIFCLFYKGVGMYEYDLDQNAWSMHPISLPSGSPNRYSDMCFVDSSTIACLWKRPFLYNIETKKVRYINRTMTKDIEGIQEIMQDQEKNIWIGTRNNGIYKYSGSDVEPIRFQSELGPGQTENYIGWFYPIVTGVNNEVYVRNKYGYTFINTKSDSVRNYFYPRDKENPFVHVSDAFYKNNSIWTLGSAIAQIDASTHKLVNSWEFAVDNPERTPILYGSHYDDGILLVDNTATIFYMKEDSFAIIPKSVGYQKTPPYGRPMSIGNKIWIGYSGGLISFDPKRLRTIPKPPRVYASEIRAQDSIVTSYQPFSRNNEIILSKGNQLISLNMAAIDFEAGQDLRFRYRINNGTWIHKKKNREVSLLLNQSGWHLIEIQARHFYTDWPEEFYQVRFYITPYWYQRKWVKICVALGFLSACIYLVRRRQKTLLEREQRKTDLANLELKLLRNQMKPHFIFNCLNTIDGYILTKSPRQASDLLNKFSVLIRQSLELSRKELITVQTELDFLRKYLRIEQIKKSHAFDFEINIKHPDKLEAFMIPPFFIQPYVENAIKHGVGSASKKVRIEILDEFRQNKYKIKVRDNGPGLSAEKSKDNQHESLATKIVMERLAGLSQVSKNGISVESSNIVNREDEVCGFEVTITIFS